MAPPRKDRAVLLAASYPPREYKSRADSHEIAAAVKALAGAIFQAGWTLVFGGHPTISPLILMIAREYDRKDRVVIYQSAYFENHIGPATRSLTSEHYGHIEFVENHPSEPPPAVGEKLDPTRCPLSLTLMRESMMQHPGIAALVLIGGDTGLRQELDLFARTHENLPVIPIAAPGGIARELLPELRAPGLQPATLEALGSSHYMTLCSELMRDLSSRRD
jgi:hypothetical protein